MSDNFQSWKKIGSKCIGMGAFGEVWKVETDTGLVLAAKYIKISAQMSTSDIDREVSILKNMDHKNVVKLITVRKPTENELVIFTEFIDGTDLAMVSRKGLKETQIVHFLRQICEGLNYLHKQTPPVLHRDLKGQNIMVTKDDQVKIIDFGLSMQLMEKSGVSATEMFITSYQCGTPCFMAPELFSGVRCHFSVKSDVWALGMTLYEMINNGAAPYVAECDNVGEIMEKITNSGAPKLPRRCSEQLADFYARCTEPNPTDRPPVRELMQHGVFKS